ncbi:uncharacterized protein LOC132735904 isoform X2 [Ruditapes philippinarum]|uniref:uncharacterized protein LOC132735904 isoform X2 n=1 Tax=Ruditapes philippinarum TaxID=129788 RepID=UPI00295A8655|nr:uncharacterized protein LOC132735904 isoform X2 [Ruditapes philippinarum]
MSRAGGTRGSKKAQTPGTSGTRQSRAGSIRSDMTPISEGDDAETLGTELSAVMPRNRYQAPPGFFSQSLTRFEQYLEDTQVQVIFRKLLQILLNRPELPYNPYPGFYGRLRVHQERFHLEKHPRQRIMANLKNVLKDSYIQNLYTLHSHQNIWGLSSILRVINPDGLEKYRWLISNITPRLDQLPTVEGYSNQVMVALIGPCIFDGSFYPSVHSVQMRLEYLVAGSDVEQGISIYVNSLMKEIDDMFNSEHHFLLGVNIPSVSLVNPDSWVKHYWGPDKIQSEKETFLQKISDAVIGNRYIYVECIFLLNPNYPSYIKGEKQYGFNFVEVSDEMREEGLSSFCEYPMASLHDGVFFERSQAEAYISIFQTQLDDFETADAYEAGEGAPPRSPGLASLGQGSQAPMTTRQSRAATAQSMNRRFSVSQQRDAHQVQQHVHNRLEHVKPRKVKIDGFRFGDEKSTGPFAWQITTPVKSNYQKKIANYWRDVELFEILYCIIILVLMDREAYDDEILVEAYRLHHSTSGQLYQLLEYNKSLRAVIQAVANTQDYPVIRTLLQQYNDAVKKLFLNPLLERSQDHVTIGMSVSAKVDDMIYSPDMEFASATHLQFSLRGLKNINLYLIPLMMELAEDSRSQCPEVNRLIKTMEDAFPEEDPRPPTRYKKRITTSFQAGEEDVADEIIRHGIEDEHIKRHETSVLNVKTCIAKDMSPQVMVKENVLMKYMLDCKFDEMWSDYLIDLAGGDLFPPNPFPRLISSLRQSTMKMDLFYEKASVLTEKLFNLEVKPEDNENFVYHIPGIDAHGCVTALMMLDTGTYVTLSEIFKSFQQRSYIQKKGPYRIGICLALSGPSIWYGRMQPYLNEIELHEHYYIQGPSGCQGEAMQLCAVVVHNHMVDMITKSGLPVMGVYFGDITPDHWTSDDVMGKKRGFLTEFAHTCAQKQSIYAKAYVLIDGWRYVTLKKYFKLHFLESASRSEAFFPENPASFYQSVFLTKDRAAFHYQNSGPPHGGDPMSIANVRAVTNFIEKNMYESQRKSDWLNYYRHLLLRDLISQDQSHIADCWRVLHCMAGQIEYVVGMMEVLQDLVLTCLQTGVDDKKQTSRQGSRGSSQGKGRKNVVEQSALTKMVMAFYQKLMYVCEARLTMAARSLTDYIESKLKSALEFDPDSGQPYLAIEDQSIFRLEEMKSIMRIFQDTLSGDVRSVCQNVEIKYQPKRLQTPQMKVGESFKKKTPRTPGTRGSIGQSRGSMDQPLDPYLTQPDVYHQTSRPPSVASSILDNPDYYRTKPANMMTIRENV